MPRAGAAHSFLLGRVLVWDLCRCGWRQSQGIDCYPAPLVFLALPHPPHATAAPDTLWSRTVVAFSGLLPWGWDWSPLHSPRPGDSRYGSINAFGVTLGTFANVLFSK